MSEFYNYSNYYPPHLPTPAGYYIPPYVGNEYEDFRWNWWNWYSSQALQHQLSVSESTKWPNANEQSQSDFLKSLPEAMKWPGNAEQAEVFKSWPGIGRMEFMKAMEKLAAQSEKTWSENNGESTGSHTPSDRPSMADLGIDAATFRAAAAAAAAHGPEYFAAAAAAGTLSKELVRKHTQRLLKGETPEAGSSAPISVRSQSSMPDSDVKRDVPRTPFVPKQKEKLVIKQEYKTGKVPVTTLMLRNIPNKYCQRELLEDLDQYGYVPGEHMNFFYLPIDPVTGANLGYAFVNFIHPDITEKFRLQLHKKQLPRHLTRKVIEVGDAAVQGLEQNQQYYARSSAIRNLDASRRPLFWSEVGLPINEAGEVTELEISSGDEEDLPKQTWVSTLMLRNLRNKFSQVDLLKELESLGFHPREHIDFLYLPIDTTTNANLGYAFVNFSEPHYVEDFKELSGQKLSRIFKQNVVVVYEASVQGIQANWDLYIRSAPINSSDPLRRPLFWPKETLKGRSEAWEGSCSTHSSSRRSGFNAERSRTTGDASSIASHASSAMPPGLLKEW